MWFWSVFPRLSLLIGDVEHTLYICWPFVLTFLWRNVFSGPLHTFKWGFLLLLSCMSSLPMLDFNPYIRYMPCKYFLPLCFFIVLLVFFFFFFSIQKLSSSRLSNFSFAAISIRWQILSYFKYTYRKIDASIKRDEEWNKSKIWYKIQRNKKK